MAPTQSITFKGTQLQFKNQPFYLQGLSFFNALFNSSFNETDEIRLQWLNKFNYYGINMLRVWCQWDFTCTEFFKKPCRFIDIADNHILYDVEGNIKEEFFHRLARLIEQAEQLNMVIEVVLFAHEKKPNSPQSVMEKFTEHMVMKLKPYGNVILQLWNEESTYVERLYKIAKKADPDRIVTNSPGIANVLGDDKQNEMLDILTPHTMRNGDGKFWEIVPEQLRDMIERFQKPIIDDEPARCGIKRHGGVIGGTQVEQHIVQIEQVRAIGAYHVYHHDMFQNGYGDETIPPSGIPDPEFSPFHRQIFEYLRDHKSW